MFNECLISCAAQQGRLLCDDGVFVCVFGFENHAWVAVGSFLCRVNLIHATQWAANNNFNQKCNF